MVDDGGGGTRVRLLSRRRLDYEADASRRQTPVHHVPTPLLHGFEREREYVRALNAVKVQRMLAKPFVGALEGHADAIWRLECHPRSVSTVVSGSCDGEIRVWNLSLREVVQARRGAHRGIVRGLSVLYRGNGLLSVGGDKTARMWSLVDPDQYNPAEEETARSAATETLRPIHTWNIEGDIPSDVSCPRDDSTQFATSGNGVLLWDYNRSTPVQRLHWGCDSVLCVRYNPSEPFLIASTGGDNAVVLYDVRASAPVRKLTLVARSNALRWNPMEPFGFAVANNNGKVYLWDARNLSKATRVLRGHYEAATDVDYSPTGLQVVSCSYDRTVRIYDARSHDDGARDVYHGRRMQRVHAVRFSLDAQYVLSASDDANVRIWKADASAQLRHMTSSEQAAVDYRTRLIERHQHYPEVRRIARQRHLPRYLHNAKQQAREVSDARVRKHERIRRHRRAGAVPDPDAKSEVVRSTE